LYLSGYFNINLICDSNHTQKFPSTWWTYTTSISMGLGVPLDLNIQTEVSPVQPTSMQCHNGQQRGTLAMQLVCPVAGSCYCY